MANNPETYDCRVTLKNCFSVLSECRRTAMKRLPVNFFVVMFNDIITTLLDENNPYSDIVIQARDSNMKYILNIDPQFIDATMDIFDNTLKKFNINDPIVSTVYREYLTRHSYIQIYIYAALSHLKHLQ